MSGSWPRLIWKNFVVSNYAIRGRTCTGFHFDPFKVLEKVNGLSFDPYFSWLATLLIALFEQVIRCFSKSEPAVRLIVKSERKAKVCLRNNCNVICNLNQTSLITSLSESALWAAIMRESPPRPHKWGNKAISLSLTRSVVTPPLSKQRLQVYISCFFSDLNVPLFNFSKLTTKQTT